MAARQLIKTVVIVTLCGVPVRGSQGKSWADSGTFLSCNYLFLHSSVMLVSGQSGHSAGTAPVLATSTGIW